MMKRFGILLLTFLFANQVKATTFDLLKSDQYTIEDGLPQSVVETIYQDKEGFLWIATQDGISRFDGYDFENFFSNPFDSTSILSNYVIGISNWGKDSTCFTTAIGVSIFDPISQNFINYPISLENKSVEKINTSVII